MSLLEVHYESPPFDLTDEKYFFTMRVLYRKPYLLSIPGK